MTKTFRDNCDINTVQQTSCEPLFPDVQIQLKCSFSFLLYDHVSITIKGVRKEGVGVNPSPLSVVFYKNFITCTEINCFRILFAC